jgi:hypothetical protein
MAVAGILGRVADVTAHTRAPFYAALAAVCQASHDKGYFVKFYVAGGASVGLVHVDRLSFSYTLVPFLTLAPIMADAREQSGEWLQGGG